MISKKLIKKAESLDSKVAWSPLAIRLLSLFIILTAGFSTLAANLTITIDRDNISVGESAVLSVKFEGVEPSDGFSLPSIPGLNLGEPSRSVQNYFSFVNGKQESSSTVEYQYSVSSSKPGNYQIPAMQVTLDGKEFVSQPINLKVSAQSRNRGGIGGAFLKMSVANTNAYLGQVIPLDVQLYYQSAQGGEMPHLAQEGFTLGKMLSPTEASTVLNGVQYRVVTFKSYVVPVKAGTVTLGPASMNIQVPRSGARDIFGRLIDWQQAALESEPLSMNVSPVPIEDRPTDFTGAVGSFNVTLSATPTNIAVGDPLTVKIAISGQGAIDSLTLPTPQGWEHFKLYPPTSDVQLTDNLGIAGTKTFSLTVVPETMDVHELPPFSFSYYDPELKRFNTIQKPGLALTVRPSAASLPMPVAGGVQTGTSTTQQANNDLAPLKVHLGELAEKGNPLILRSWFVTSQTLPVVFALLALVYRKRTDSLLNNPRLLRHRQVEQVIRQGMTELRTYATANDSEKFYATVFRLMQEKIGDSLDVAASGITESVLDERLKPAGMSAESLEALRELFHACNQARYSRQSSASELGNMIPKVQEALAKLESLRK